jgi:acetone carboxylase gamma subunit
MNLQTNEELTTPKTNLFDYESMLTDSPIQCPYCAEVLSISPKLFKERVAPSQTITCSCGHDFYAEQAINY